jgi:hypothetical protein
MKLLSSFCPHNLFVFYAVRVISKKNIRLVLTSLLLLLLLLFLLLPLGAQGIRETLVSVHFLNLRQAVGLLGRGISPPQGRYLTQRQNKCKQTSMH